jgi:flagellar motor protein MotB
MRRRAASGHDEGDVPWASFADALTGLLFVFMLLTVVFMQSAAKTQAEAKDEQAKAAKELERLRGYGRRAEEVAKSSKACLERHKIQIIKGEAGTPDAAALSVLLSVGWFESAKVNLEGQACKTTKQVAECLAAALSRSDLLPRTDKLRVLVEGHTDSKTMATTVFPSNWELSGARAAAVVRALTDQGATCTPDRAHRDTLNKAIQDGRIELIAVGRADQAPSKAVICEASSDPVCKNPPTGPELIRWANNTEDRQLRLRRVDLRFEVQPKPEAIDANP